MRISIALVLCSTFLAGCEAPSSELDSSEQASDTVDDEHGKPEPPMLGAHGVRGARPSGGGSSSPNMTWHNGPVLTDVEIQPIFWGKSWANYSGDKQSGLASFYEGYIGSTYARTNIEYHGLGTTFVTATNITYTAAITDTSAGPSGAPKTSAILAEVCKKITNPTAGGYYPVYTDTPRGRAAYCAWHSWGSCGAVPVQFGFFFKLDGDSGCDPQDTTSGRSQGLSALANVSGHELSETVTDPRGTGWLDSSGGENGDKCAWVFTQPVDLADGSTWKIQGNWSNAAYNAGTGLANSGGQKGCLYNN